MDTRFVASQLSKKLEEKDILEYQKTTQAKLKKGYQSRVFDGLSLADAGTIFILSMEYKNIIKQLQYEAQKLPEIYAIADDSHETVFANLKITALLDKVSKQILTESTKVLLTTFLEKIIKISCEKLLNGANQLRLDVITLLDWEAYSQNLIPTQIVSSYVHHILADIIHQVCKNSNASFQLTNFVVNQFMSDNYVKLTESYMIKHQENDFYKNNISNCVKYLLKMTSESSLKLIDQLIQNDLESVSLKSALYQKKYYFWLNVLYQYGVIYRNSLIFPTLWYYLNDYYFVVLDDIANKKYNDCKQSYSRLSISHHHSLETKKENDLDDVSQIKKIILHVEKNQVIDEIIKTYHNSEMFDGYKKDEEDFIFLKKLMKFADTGEGSIQEELASLVNQVPSKLRLHRILSFFIESFMAKVEQKNCQNNILQSYLNIT